ncbi:hypothetical protein [Mycetocola zhujimingii]|uniref:Type 4 fimbrial biogenesis protein PilX N-terminal domain-containing protein n=1 Tax=Mycetocola zhujimingii TaxID=2079792 RepID=A0A2U1TCW6_9MICO|nr:hypothetical protein [Mycetocola zhujimingii]PWC06737.1 hypothetical protein DF223_09750 [Mycetocola zhujimingii]
MKRVNALTVRGSETGAALVMVIVIGFVLMVMVATATTVALSSTVKSDTDQNWNGAMAAAYAGVEDYQSKLSNDNSYVKYGNPSAPFSSGSVVTLPTGALQNKAFGIGPDGTWASVAGSDGTASYRYEVDSSAYGVSGLLRLRSSGRVGESVRTLVVNVKQQGFIDFLYFTEYEMTDPAQVKKSSERCSVDYAWNRDSQAHPSRCNLRFAADDVISGPVHSNDSLLICGSEFNGKVTTSNPNAPHWLKDSASCAAPKFNSGLPVQTPKIGMPATNLEQKKETRYDLGDTVPRPGCLYTGPTVITYTSDGKMNVKSPFSTRTQVAGNPARAGREAAQCGREAALKSSAGATIAVLAENLIFVQDVPSDPLDPNYWANTANPGGGYSCKSSGTGWSFGGNSFPRADETVPWASPSHYQCRKGDVFIQGTLKGKMTVYAENYVYITGDIKYVDKLKDILGLVGQSAVWVWNPVECTNTNRENECIRGDFFYGDNRRIDAAILSVGHTFTVQNYTIEDGGANAGRGTLTVSGAIAQNFRGAVATAAGTGYKKDYKYDDRFRYLAPPKFLSPVSTTYGISQLVEIQAAFAPDGTSR